MEAVPVASSGLVLTGFPSPGDYEVSIKFNDEHIPDSPFVVPVASLSDDARRLTVTSLQVCVWGWGPSVTLRGGQESSMAGPCGQGLSTYLGWARETAPLFQCLHSTGSSMPPSSCP